eukprot:GHVU01013965.1.p1 GENE.GHVU01013965.1~~GHVU01013965.1.p1  ORF type:complete len:1063 (+),score=157.56 GHVU01013965.1:481-3669(+)
MSARTLHFSLWFCFFVLARTTSKFTEVYSKFTEVYSKLAPEVYSKLAPIPRHLGCWKIHEDSEKLGMIKTYPMPIPAGGTSSPMHCQKLCRDKGYPLTGVIDNADGVDACSCGYDYIRFWWTLASDCNRQCKDGSPCGGTRVVKNTAFRSQETDDDNSTTTAVGESTSASPETAYKDASMLEKADDGAEEPAATTPAERALATFAERASVTVAGWANTTNATLVALTKNVTAALSSGEIAIRYYRSVYATQDLQYVGCNVVFNDTTKVQNTLLGFDSAHVCVTKCSGLGYEYAAVRVKGTCICDNEPPGKALSRVEGLCRLPCLDGTRCGGHVGHSVYRTDVYRGVERHLGCFRDDLRDHAMAHTRTLPGTSPTSCVDYCRARGYPIAGLSHKILCSCGYEPRKHGKKSNDACAALPCDDGGECGGMAAMSTYQTFGLRYKGCYADDEKDPAMTDRVTIGNDGAVYCVARCKALGYKYAGMQGGKKCFCSQGGFDKHGAAEDASSCTEVCADDSHCGGKQANSVYYADHYDSAAYQIKQFGGMLIGCYLDEKKDRAMHEYFLHGHDGDSLWDCVSRCREAGYLMAGAEDSWQCWCGDAPSHHGLAPNPGECNMRCRDGGECGGSYRMSTYILSQQQHALVPKGEIAEDGRHRYVGCFGKNNTSAMTNFGKPPGIQSSPQPCYELCKSNGYAYAAVHDATTCFCGLEYGPLRGEVEEAECTSSCPAKCGGQDAVSLFHVGRWVGGMDTHIGCFKNRAMEEKMRRRSWGSSPADCVAKCNTFFYPYAGVQRGRDCWCGHAFDDRPPANSSQCGTPCAGSGSPGCGGSHRIDVYATSYYYGINLQLEKYGAYDFGCWNAGTKEQAPAMRGHASEIDGGSPAECVQVCDKKFAYAGIGGDGTGKKVCYCSHRLPAYGRGAPGDCSESCSNGDRCGGDSAISIWVTRQHKVVYSALSDDKTDVKEIHVHPPTVKLHPTPPNTTTITTPAATTTMTTDTATDATTAAPAPESAAIAQTSSDAGGAGAAARSSDQFVSSNGAVKGQRTSMRGVASVSRRPAAIREHVFV